MVAAEHVRAGARDRTWVAASRLLDEWGESDGQRCGSPTYQRCRALLAAGRGEAQAAEQWAVPALADAQARGYRWQVLEAFRALGMARWSPTSPGTPSGWLLTAWQHTQDQGVEGPGAFPVAPDLVEALIGAGEPGEAAAVSARLANWPSCTASVGARFREAVRRRGHALFRKA